MDGSLPIRRGFRGAGRTLAGIPVSIDWLLCCVALTALEFLQYSQTLAAYTFTGATMICVVREPARALDAAYRGLVLWLFVALCTVSVLWSPASGTALRSALEIALTVGVSLVIARALSASSFLLAVMCALLIATAATLMNPHMAMNAGALALRGIFGSKNQMGLSQTLLMLVGAWVFLDARRSPMARGVALLGVAVGFSLSIAARSLDSTLVVIVALGCSYFAFRLNWAPPRWRPAILYGAILSMVLLFAFLLIATSNLDLFGQGLAFFGKDSTLTGRTVLWDRAAKMMQENPFLGTGLEGFWVAGNPYAEELWARFQPGRTGYNFHNEWYEMGVQFGYVGLAVVFLIVVGTSVRVLRWVVRSPTPASCFFLAFVVFIDIRSFVESELLSQFSMMTLLLVAARVYARRSREQGV
jgi:exopolysaccharide production protein ExoQ